MRYSRAELLFTWRRRKGLTQAQAAEHFGVGVNRYRDWEQNGVPRTVATPEVNAEVKPAKLKVHEVCVILRRRAGVTACRLHLDIDCSRNWLCQMERGEAPVRRLLRYWDERLRQKPRGWLDVDEPRGFLYDVEARNG